MLPPPPKIAVLLAAYNGMPWIEPQLATIQAQVGVEVQIIISVDASSDGTEAWCEAYSAKHGNVCLLPPSERCGGAARNFFHLIRDANLEGFDFVALSDQDDLWHTDKLQRAATFLSCNPVDVYSSNVTAFWPDGKKKLLEKAQPQVRWDHYFEAAGPGCTYVLKSEFTEYFQSHVKVKWASLQKVSLHDWYIYAFARSNGYNWYIDPISTMDYRQHQTNQFGANVGLSALLSRYWTVQNGWWLGQVKLIESLVNDDKKAEQRPKWHKLQRSDFVEMCLNASKFRRKRRDKLLFSAFCVTAAITGR